MSRGSTNDTRGPRRSCDRRTGPINSLDLRDRGDLIQDISRTRTDVAIIVPQRANQFFRNLVIIYKGLPECHVYNRLGPRQHTRGNPSFGRRSFPCASLLFQSWRVRHTRPKGDVHIYFIISKSISRFGHPSDAKREMSGLCENGNTGLVHLLRARACHT